MAIMNSVGNGAVNDLFDVQTVEALLVAQRHWLEPMPALIPDGFCTPETVAAIRRFQETGAALPKEDVDGIVAPGSFTFRRLEMGRVPYPKHDVFKPVCWYRDSSSITRSRCEAAAKRLDCEVEAVIAVIEQEVAIRGMWDEFGRPTILYEPAHFRRHTDNKWDKTHRDISNGGIGSGKFSAQYPKLLRAATLDETAALLSASWGAFQIMGSNYKPCGFASVDAFVDAMLAGAQQQFDAFVSFLLNDPKQKRSSLPAMRNADWTAFARGYNGPDGVARGYDSQIEAVYKRLVARRPPAARR